jgi:hypothetical protein
MLFMSTKWKMFFLYFDFDMDGNIAFQMDFPEMLNTYSFRC